MPRTDEQIYKDVVDQLYWDDRVDAAEVNVEVNAGVVTLSGSVPTTAARQSAFVDAWAVEGVSRVDNELSTTRPEVAERPSDTDIEANARHTLSWNASIDAADIRIDVENGLVALEGTVDAYWKKIEAEDLVSTIHGVVKVENELAVVPTKDVLDKTIAEDVVGALERNVLVNAEDITVEVENGTVTLSGTVPSWAARRAAYDAALYTYGVIDIEDNLAAMSAPAGPQAP